MSSLIYLPKQSSVAREQFVEGLHAGLVFQGFAVEDILYRDTSPYQAIDIYQTKTLGRVLVLDGIVQTTENDEFIYHEMLVHVPMFACAAPREVLIIGGGDGGALREVLKHDVERVDMIEIDQKVISACIEFMPSLNCAGRVFDDPRTNLVVEDAFEFLGREKRRYDVIISDSTDPVGAGEILFSDEFYRLCEASLKPSGVISLQNGVAFLQPHEPRGTMRALRARNLLATCYLTCVPTYYGGPMTLAFATRDATVLNVSSDALSERFNARPMTLKHYSPAVHAASFVLPQWIKALTEDLS